MAISHGRATGRGTQGPSVTFTGTVFLDPVLQAAGIAVNDVTFTPGARTFWHRHPGGQLLIVKAGRGVVVTRDGRAIPVEAGDVLWTPPGEDHWHGAGPDSLLAHTAISHGQTEWQEEVTVSEYAARTADT
jgi:quercetin dioxygenase-like cupin family protein